MTNVLVLGANGQIARVATDLLLKQTDARLTLYLRSAKRLKLTGHHDRVRVIEGDVLDLKTLETAMDGQNVVYANLAGQMEQQARNIVNAMHTAGVKRLIFISSMGIYGEIPGERYDSILDPYRDSVRVIEASDLDYTILRPAWLNNRDEIDYATTQKDEPFKNPSGIVSRQSVADLVVKLAITPGLEIRSSLGVHKPALTPVSMQGNLIFIDAGKSSSVEERTRRSRLRSHLPRTGQTTLQTTTTWPRSTCKTFLSSADS